ncbi:anthrax toxin-like adenylyl cyclase domain-containing protein [Robbsia sp. KACC 23696]|uniref:anthrax toxin-like adenylyl cyclase domain-containing protein n=1 Tax=Robbsia sp. KACC 23696 TaxID=3149231 RepID=UPI00325B9CD8
MRITPQAPHTRPLRWPASAASRAEGTAAAGSSACTGRFSSFLCGSSGIAPTLSSARSSVARLDARNVRSGTSGAGSDLPGVEPAPPLLYGDAIQSVSDHVRVVIGLRAPNPTATPLLRQGYPAKNFHLKAKSSADGPTAGFVPVKAEYAKVAVEHRDAHARAVVDALRSGARAIPLVLTGGQIDTLKRRAKIVEVRPRHYVAAYHGKMKAFSIDRRGRVLDEHGAAVEVLSNPQTAEQSSAALAIVPRSGLPADAPGMTAPPRAMRAIVTLPPVMPVTVDYDLFTLIPLRGQAANQRPVPLRAKMQEGQLALPGGAVRRWRGTGGFCLIGVDRRVRHDPAASEDPDMGNVHPFGRRIISMLNDAIRRSGYRGGDLVCHNDETGNPFSNGFDPHDCPIFFVPGEPHPFHLPYVPVRHEGRGAVAVFLTRHFAGQRLRRFYDCLRARGFVPETSALFGI